MASTIECCDFLDVGVHVRAGRYVGSGADCDYRINGRSNVVIPGGQVVLDLRDGDRVYSSCTLRQGSGASGAVRGPGIHVGVPAGGYITDAPCLFLFNGNDLLRAGTGSSVSKDANGVFHLDGSAVVINAGCGGIRPA